MVQTDELIAYLNETLDAERFSDYGPNGLQVAGKKEINHVVTGVTANRALIEAAIKDNADAIVVHHGIFWKGGQMTLTGVQHGRVKPLMSHDINLIAYHLPLDAHQVVGNNAQLGKLLEIDIEEYVDLDRVPGLCAIGRLDKPLSGQAFAQRLNERLLKAPLHVPAEKEIKRVAWCTGAAHSYLPQILQMDVDAYITGEYSLAMVELAIEADIHFYAAGHHATERGGVIALGEQLAKQFGITVNYIDIDNPA